MQIIDTGISNYLTALKFETLTFTNRKGTNLTVGLPEKQVWHGDPSCIAPDKLRITGTVVSTKPLYYKGQSIKGIKIEFADGKAIEYSAKINNDLLKDIIESDEDACYVSEIAVSQNLKVTTPREMYVVPKPNTSFYHAPHHNPYCHIKLGTSYDVDPIIFSNIATKIVADGSSGAVTLLDNVGYWGRTY